MADVVVALGARQAAGGVGGVGGVNRRRDLGVAFPACHLGDLLIPRGDTDRIRKAAGREIELVPEPVLRLRQVLRHEPGWRVAIVADGDRAMAGALPGREMIAHDVAVGARRRVIRHVRPDLGVQKRVAADADDESERYADENSLKSSQVHRSESDQPSLKHVKRNAERRTSSAVIDRVSFNSATVISVSPFLKSAQIFHHGTALLYGKGKL